MAEKSSLCLAQSSIQVSSANWGDHAHQELNIHYFLENVAMQSIPPQMEKDPKR